jgi:hypothetical protein
MNEVYILRSLFAGGRWWRLKYRFAGQQNRVSLGVYPDVASKPREGAVMKRARS